MTVLHTYFLGLAAIGYDALWGTLIKSGTAKAIAAVKATGTLPDGNILRQIYTGLPSIDRLLISPVIFYDGLMRQRNPIFRSLLVGLFCTMQTTSFCIISAGWLHKSPRWWIIIEPIFWGVANQSYGAAFVYPLYLFVHAHQATSTPNCNSPATLSSTDAEALLYTAVIAGVLPVWLLLPAFVPCSSETRQMLIATYRLTPIILPLSQPLISMLIKMVRRKVLAKENIQPFVQASFVLSGAFSVVGHWYAIVYGILSPRATLAGIFWPWATEIEGASFDSIIGLGCHLFLQNDFWIILAGFVPFASAILCNSTGKSESGEQGTVLLRAKRFLLSIKGNYLSLGVFGCFFSPGALLAWSMAATV